MVVQLVRDVQDGRRDSSMGQLFESAVPVLGALILAGILAGIGITIGLVLIIIPGLILLTWWAVIVPAIVIDKTGVMGSFGRSRELVRHNGWRVFGVLLVLFLLQLVLGGVVNALANGISDSFASYAIADLIVRVLLVPLSGIAATVMYVELRRLKGEALAADAPTAPAPAPPETPAV
jgi:hypothetical protein